MTTKDIIQNVDIEKIAKEGTAIYEQVKSKYDPAHRGEFLAIEIESKKIYLANTSIEAIELAQKDFPDKVFYVAKIGFDSAQTIAKSFLGMQ